MTDPNQITSEDSLDILTTMIDAIEIMAVSNKDENATFSERGKIKPPSYMQKSAQRGLKMREKQPANKKCGNTDLTRAGQLAEGDYVSPRMVRRMKSFIDRMKGKLTPDILKDDPLIQELLLWGCAPTDRSVNQYSEWCEKQINKMDGGKK